ncbi:MAG: hypothetical protein M1824_000189 [Vezdaea acicularis]|nr:MAG: hypothetical protein M1824_000189 [Vezdaea acicularis]
MAGTQASPMLDASPQAPRLGLRRAFTLPQKLNKESSNSEPDREMVKGQLTDVIYRLPKAKIVLFKPILAEDRPASSSGLRRRGGSVIAPGTLLWASWSERVLSAGFINVYKSPQSFPFLAGSGSLFLPIFPKSQCWCVDGVSKFALTAREGAYYRIELPNESITDTENVAGFKDVIRGLLLYEKTPCPFKRSFTVDLPPPPETPQKLKPFTIKAPSINQQPLQQKGDESIKSPRQRKPRTLEQAVPSQRSLEDLSSTDERASTPLSTTSAEDSVGSAESPVGDGEHKGGVVKQRVEKISQDVLQHTSREDSKVKQPAVTEPERLVEVAGRPIAEQEELESVSTDELVPKVDASKSPEVVLAPVRMELEQQITPVEEPTKEQLKPEDVALPDSPAEEAAFNPIEVVRPFELAEADSAPILVEQPMELPQVDGSQDLDSADEYMTAHSEAGSVDSFDLVFDGEEDADAESTPRALYPPPLHSHISHTSIRPRALNGFRSVTAPPHLTTQTTPPSMSTSPAVPIYRPSNPPSLASSVDSFHSFHSPISPLPPSPPDTPPSPRNSYRKGHTRDRSDATITPSDTSSLWDLRPESPQATPQPADTSISERLTQETPSRPTTPDLTTSPSSPEPSKAPYTPIRTRLSRHRRSLSPMPPASILYTPLHDTNSSLPSGLLQTSCSLLLQPPMWMLRIMLEVARSIANGVLRGSLVEGGVRADWDYTGYGGDAATEDHALGEMDDFGVPITSPKRKEREEIRRRRGRAKAPAKYDSADDVD